jgi:two-component system, OmpR family, response regulator
MAKILLIEDDVDLTIIIQGWLASHSHIVEVVHNGTDGMYALRVSEFDVIILDWELPAMSGIEILKQYRDEGGKTPVIMLTGKRSIDDKESGLDHGADDYLTKPFHMKELAARVRSLLRRGTNVQTNVLQVGDVTLDTNQHRVTRNGVNVQLLPREFALLEFLMRHPGEVFSSDALLQRVWHSESEATVEAIRTCVKRLRQKLDENEDESLIETIARVGYRLKVN